VAPPEYIEFLPDQVDAVLARMKALRDAHRGWINLQPGIPEAAAGAVRGSGLFAIFSGRGPEVPVCTWTAGTAGRRPEPISVGVLHGTGPRALTRLQEKGWPLPDGWRLLQDHSKRGIVCTIPAGAADGDVLRWMIGAGTALALVPLTGSWLATVHV
jgi:hypothetical protein